MPMAIGSVLIIIAIGYYFYTAGGSQVTDSQSLSFDVTAASSTSSMVGTDVLSLLKKIHQLKIDYKFFETPAEQSLFDFSQQIPPENVGRPNPFLPIGGAIMTTPASSTVNTKIPPLPKKK
jgi:hypothetical protein